MTLGDIKFIKHRRHRWCACPKCGKERWVSLNAINNNLKFTGLCGDCSKRTIRCRLPFHKSTGYIMVYLFPDSPYYSMANKNHYTGEHRLLMAKYLGRCLMKNEVVHHRNHIRDDNRLENLELLSKSRHHPWLDIDRKIKRLEEEMTKLKKENRLLLWLIKELQSQKEVYHYTGRDESSYKT